jgi:hypothetical protein
MKQIALTQGKVAMVDDEDYERLSKYNYFAHKRFNNWYALRHDENHATRRMHHDVLNLPSNALVDHKDGDGLNNQKENLRDATKSQNAANSRIRGGSSKYKGVSWKEPSKKWQAKICIDYKQIYLGLHESEIAAALAYDAAAIKHFGEYARLNFPELNEKSG